MDFELFIPIIAIVGGLSLSAFFLYGFFSLIRYWIDSRSRKNLPLVDMVTKDEFLEYKTRVEKRLQALEAVVSDEDLKEAKASLNEGLTDMVRPSSFQDTPSPQPASRLKNQLRS